MQERRRFRLGVMEANDTTRCVVNIVRSYTPFKTHRANKVSMTKKMIRLQSRERVLTRSWSEYGVLRQETASTIGHALW